MQLTEIEILTQNYKKLSSSYFDLERLNFYLISHHSTAIEGNTLTKIETEIFLEKGLTAKGKPLEHHLMVKDHFEALIFVSDAAKSKSIINTQLIQAINAKIMNSTGGVYNTPLGNFNSAKGDLRLLNVKAGISGDSYMNYDKVPGHLKNLCADLEEKIGKVKSISEINELAFLAHYQMVTIHPFVDGNGRTARLLMNYIQSFHDLPMSIVFESDRDYYIESLIETRKKEDIQIFLDFMNKQLIKFLKEEIVSFNKPVSKGNFGIGLVF
jgi:Fic family protein